MYFFANILIRDEYNELRVVQHLLPHLPFLPSIATTVYKLL